MVKSYRAKTEYGFISVYGAEDVYLPRYAVEDIKSNPIEPGQRVRFKIERERNSRRFVATNVTRIEVSQ